MNQKKKNCRPEIAGIKSLAPWLLLLTLCLAGCVTHSTVQTRIQERNAAYEAFSSDVKQMVAQGRIQVGMDTNA
ncbi:MAG TPA: hypothetical protein VFF11_12710, partial [Candidatus Binatia bacterium]|nr:hypothetical protein [Candidatus Binatia bacterium]